MTPRPARKLTIAAPIALALCALCLTAPALAQVPAENRTLDGAGNNAANPDWGRAGTNYLRVGAANYADGASQMVAGPPTRFISNRIFNDLGRDIFSENGISQWGWAWGQFMDHDFGLRVQTGGESSPIAFDSGDPLERFTNDFGQIPFSRTPAASGTGTGSPRQHANTISSYIDGSGVFGVDDARLDWLREGPVDGNSANNDAELLLPGGFLPRRDARGDASSAPSMDLMGGLAATPSRAAVAGDVRANENIALTSLHTLFAREHNRVVAALPNTLTEEQKFQIARRVVGAEQQFITYEEFLPSLGVDLPAYTGYDPTVNPGLQNEFAVVGYRAHSMIHGDFETTAPPGSYTAAQIQDFRDQGIDVVQRPNGVDLTIPLTAAFGNPDLLEDVGMEPLVEALGDETQYRNDEQIDDTLRSVLFQVPRPGIPDPSVCGSPVVDPDCFTGVIDLGATDVERGRDHGMPSYNALRQAYGLPVVTSFTQITGEPTDQFPNDPQIDQADPINDPDILDFIQGNNRRTTIAARLRAIYGNVNAVDAFVGMVSERHLPGREFGPLQLAIWRSQFETLRDGDRFFYLNDPALETIRQQFGVDFRQSLTDVIERNAGVDADANVFTVADDDAVAAPAAPAPAGVTPAATSSEDEDPSCAKLRRKLKKAKTKKARRSARRKLAKLDC